MVRFDLVCYAVNTFMAVETIQNEERTHTHTHWSEQWTKTKGAAVIGSMWQIRFSSFDWIMWYIWLVSSGCYLLLLFVFLYDICKFPTHHARARENIWWQVAMWLTSKLHYYIYSSSSSPYFLTFCFVRSIIPLWHNIIYLGAWVNENKSSSKIIKKTREIKI